MADTFEGLAGAPHPGASGLRDGSHAALLAQRQISLAETLDRVLNKGVVLVGEITLSIADIDLLYLGVNVILSSIDTIERLRREAIDGRTSH
jgi:hypothetical protein